ncbi:MAG: type II toxin-antitoxin system HipA family toxin [Verrucomicrobiota bacterium]
MSPVHIRLWGQTVGAITLDPSSPAAFFEYDADFMDSGLNVSPLMMPLADGVYNFPDLGRINAFEGLPGLVSDSLPDKFGKQIINRWLSDQGREPNTATPIERLCYTGTRAMGALEYFPALGPSPEEGSQLEVARLVHLANEVLSDRSGLDTSLDDSKGFHDILLVGTSAGGARAKAVVAWNPATNEVRSGQVDTAAGFQHWLIKFDGITGNRDKELADPQGYGCIEYAYHLMAREAGITMSDCRLMEENGRHHFMTRRFDRLPDGQKLHMQSLGAMAHLDFNDAGAHSYEEALLVARRLDLSAADREQLTRRALFNIVARNQDDHVKNIAFLMDKQGTWSLSPAYDVVYSYNPTGAWTGQHQMSLHGKRDHFTRADLKTFDQFALLPRGRALRILDEIISVVRRWPDFAETAGVGEESMRKIRKAHRLDFPAS